MAEIRPNSKGHCVTTTKRHIKDVREMTLEEWNDMLPVLKDTIKKIQKVYNPVGFFNMLPTGKLGNQNFSHFYFRTVPKYKKGYGVMGMREHCVPATPEQVKRIENALQPNSEGVYSEKSKVVAKLHNEVTFACTNYFS